MLKEVREYGPAESDENRLQLQSCVNLTRAWFSPARFGGEIMPP